MLTGQTSGCPEIFLTTKLVLCTVMFILPKKKTLWNIRNDHWQSMFWQLKGFWLCAHCQGKSQWSWVQLNCPPNVNWKKKNACESLAFVHVFWELNMFERGNVKHKGVSNRNSQRWVGKKYFHNVNRNKGPTHAHTDSRNNVHVGAQNSWIHWSLQLFDPQMRQFSWLISRHHRKSHGKKFLSKKMRDYFLILSPSNRPKPFLCKWNLLDPRALLNLPTSSIYSS